MDFHVRAVKADKEAREDTKKMLLKKYPYIDLSRFKILTHIDGDAKAHPEVVFMDKSSGREIDLHMDKLNASGEEALVFSKPKPPFPALWTGNGVVHTLPKGKAHGTLENRWYDGFPNVNVLDYPINGFRVYANEKDYFMSQLPVLGVPKPSAERWDDNNGYYQVLFATYCASYCCEVSMQHLRSTPGLYPIITAVMRFHLYFTERRIVRRIQRGESASAISREFGAGGVEGFCGQVSKVPRVEYWRTVRLSDGTMGEKAFHSLNPDYATDYRKYIH